MMTVVMMMQPVKCGDGAVFTATFAYTLHRMRMGILNARMVMA